MDYAKLQELNRFLWQSYEKAITPDAESPLAFTLRVRAERDASALVDRLKAQGCEILWLKSSRWPFGRRWEIAAKTPEPIRHSLEAIDQWGKGLLTVIRGSDAVLQHWVPLEPDA